MLIKRIIGANRFLGAPPDWDESKEMQCNVLPICDVQTEQGAFMVSAWEPTPDELAAINNGQSIYLWIRGSSHPVVALSVGEANDK